MMTSRYTSLLALVENYNRTKKKTHLSTREMVQAEVWVQAEWPWEQAQATRGPWGGPVPVQAGPAAQIGRASEISGFLLYRLKPSFHA